MCLAIPMKIVELPETSRAVAELEGSRQPVDVSLIDGPAVGDYVIVHAGYAIERLDVDEAEATLSMFDQLADAGADRA